MFYVDSQRTVTRRDSSLVSKKISSEDVNSSPNRMTSARLNSESTTSVQSRPWGSVQKEIITSLFESMLDAIVDSWEIIAQQRQEESSPTMDMGKTSSEVTFSAKKKRPAAKPSKTNKKSHSKMDFNENAPIDPMLHSWWSAPDEKAVIRFKNGNIYEGNISMKCMHGEGRFQWADGTVFLGTFHDNVMERGTLYWKDDTWYEGDFTGNLRHGQGLYVDSRNNRCYAGSWYCGTKHGQGVMYYTPKSTYDGDWVHNLRHGYGVREYCPLSGYMGEWDSYIRSGKGMLIWPNHDFYRGDWKNGMMHGFGYYVWHAYYNNSMSLPSVNAYRGSWIKGLRSGYGLLNLGLGLGSHYQGHFIDNKKNGPGQFITNNGLILADKYLFYDDILGPRDPDNPADPEVLEPFQFNICDDTVGLNYHVERVLESFDKEVELRTNMVNEFLRNNMNNDANLNVPECVSTLQSEKSNLNLADMMAFEESSLRKAMRCYETDLKLIYYQYATICNTAVIAFTPVLIRLYLWQFYNDINIHHKGLTLVQIDRLFHRNRNWLSKSPHNPFEKIYFWQFLHNLTVVSNKLYAKKCAPGAKPDTICASAFREFMEMDVMPGFGRRNGRLTTGLSQFVPLRALHELYRSLGEPHTVREFLCAVHRQPHLDDCPRPELVELPEEEVPLGHNAFIFGDQMSFVTDEILPKRVVEESQLCKILPLFNFCNLSSKAIIKILADILPPVCNGDVIMDLDVEFTFYEFFEAFITCTEESIRVKDEEIRMRERFSAQLQPQSLRPSHAGHPKKSTVGGNVHSHSKEPNVGRASQAAK